MIVCLFGLRYREGADRAEENRVSLALLSQLRQSPGFISYHAYSGEDGDELGVIRFESREALEAWRNHPAHRATWSRAREFYKEFWIQNCDTYREYFWEDGLRSDGDLTGRFVQLAAIADDLSVEGAVVVAGWHPPRAENT